MYSWIFFLEKSGYEKAENQCIRTYVLYDEANKIARP